MTEVHQIIPSFARYDAIGSHTRALRDLLRSWGYSSTIYADSIEPSIATQALPIAAFPRTSRRDRFLIYQASTNSRLAAWLRDRREPVIINYHNVTPWQLTQPWEPNIAKVLRQARFEIGSLSHVASGALTVSEFNAVDLFQLGYHTPRVVAPLISFDTAPANPPERAGGRWLFVGRIFPNKNQRALLGALAIYRRLYDSEATLTLVGSVASDTYANELFRLVDALGLHDAVTHLHDLSPIELQTVWSGSNLFISASLHEGFCFPIVEAFHHRRPVLALGTSAVAETARDAGWVLPTWNPLEVAASAHRIAIDSTLRERMCATGVSRLAAFEPEALADAYRHALSSFIPDPEPAPR
ncbi:MAG: glycosyltransferase family 4 protein [Ferrimicrobium sp.]